VLALPTLRGGSATLLPLALESLLEEQAQVAQFQLLLHVDGALELRLPQDDGPTNTPANTPANAAFARCRQALADWFAAQGLAPVRLVHGHQPPCMQAGSGKLRRVIDLRAAPGRREHP
jgi:hypothetical protein